MLGVLVQTEVNLGLGSTPTVFSAVSPPPPPPLSPDNGGRPFRGGSSKQKSV